MNVARDRGARLPNIRVAVFDDPIGRILLVAGLLVAGLAPTIRDGHLLEDMAAYVGAADALIRGESIYAPFPGDVAPYRYAPWFAVLWVPLTLLPDAMLGGLWLGVQLSGAAWLLWRAPWWLALITGPFIAWGAAIGNTAPLMFTALAIALPTRAAGVAIGAAASLKAFPILLLIPLVLHRRWQDVAIAAAVMVSLVAPMLFFDLSEYPVASEGPRSIFNVVGPAAWLATAVAAVLIAVLRPSWRSAGLAVLLANPRFHWYDLGYLLIGEPRPATGQTGGSQESAMTQAR